MSSRGNQDQGPSTDMLRKLVCRRICSCKPLDGWNGEREREWLKERVDRGGGGHPVCDGRISVLRLQLHHSWMFHLYQNPNVVDVFGAGVFESRVKDCCLF